MAELMGRSAGLCQGLGGSMHLVDTAHGLMGATGVVGGNLPMAAGDALAAKLRGTDRVTVVFFGDGAVQAGHFHETVNLAALWELPLIFVCENNGVAEFTTRAEHSTIERVSDVVAPYGIPAPHGRRRRRAGGVERRRRVRAGRPRGPGTAAAGVPDPPLPRPLRGRRRRPTATRSPNRNGRALDPIVRLQSRATELGWWDEDVARSLEREARAEVEAAVAFGRDSPPLDVSSGGRARVRGRRS